MHLMDHSEETLPTWSSRIWSGSPVCRWRSSAVGDSAVLDALELAAAGSSVVLIYRSPYLTARRDLVERVRAEGRITEMAAWTLHMLVGSDHLQGIDVSNGGTGEHRRLDVRGVVLKLGREQRVDLVRNQLDLGTHGGIVVNADLRTSARGHLLPGM